MAGGRGAGTDAGSRRIHTGAGLYWEYRGGRHAPGCIIVLQQNNRPPLLYSPCTWEEDVKEGLLGRAIALRCPLGRGCGSLVGAGDNGPGTGVVLGNVSDHGDIIRAADMGYIPYTMYPGVVTYLVFTIMLCMYVYPCASVSYCWIIAPCGFLCPPPPFQQVLFLLVILGILNCCLFVCPGG